MTEELKLAICFLLIAAIGYVLLRTGVLHVLTNRPAARCRDGSMSFSEHRCGTCSHHGGVAEFLSA
jgi:hypothetical protein